MKNIEKIESDLWEAADNLRANSKLTSSDYFMPVLGVIFLRHAANRFDTAAKQIEEDQASGKMPKRKVVPEDYVRRRSLWLPENARYDWIMEHATSSSSDLPQLVTDAMTAIEDFYQPLQGVLPKDYGIFESNVLEDLMRTFHSEQLKQATGDVFGRIYEYFLAKFSIQKAHDNGEFFTPFSIVQTIVNVIEPNHGIIFDPASGSGGMFVQSSHFIEHTGGDTAQKVVFYGQEKNPDTIRIAKMNLAVHGLEGKIAEAITYYQDEHTFNEKCDFVMANPPFNVDLVDAERIKNDIRLPFGLPGVNQRKKVSNGNYLWISYFWSYLNEQGRAGFVMSSQASSAGHDEKTVRKKIVETGDVDVMIAIRSNFFYTRSVPCELWLFDKGKPEHLKDNVLMLDARNIFRKVTRKIYDFSTEQLKNITAIVWLYRGHSDRYLTLIKEYFESVCAECGIIPEKLEAFEKTSGEIEDLILPFLDEIKKEEEVDKEKLTQLEESVKELREAKALYEKDRSNTIKDTDKYVKSICKTIPEKNNEQHKAAKSFEPIADKLKGLVKQLDLIYKIVMRSIDLTEKELNAKDFESWNKKSVNKAKRELEPLRKDAVEQLKLARYFYKQVVWLQTRFPKAELIDVPGLVKLVDRNAIEQNDWSLTPGRYVGVAPPEEDADFDFEEALKDIHVELSDLNKEAIDLASTIQANFEELGI